MRVLYPEAADDVDVYDWYAHDWVQPGGVRANFVVAVDGAAQAGGVSRGLQTPGDNTVFAALRDLADVVLVGAGTATAENYGAVTLSARRRTIRNRYGLAEALPIAVLSRSLHLDATHALFADAGPDNRTVVLTCAAADPARRRALDQVADVVDCGTDTVEPALARRALEQRGHRRILFEGGPSVLADFTAAHAVDELCLSVSPMLIGPGPGRITAGDEWAQGLPLQLTGLLEEDGALFARYRT